MKNIFLALVLVLLVGCTNMSKEKNHFDYAGTLNVLEMSTWSYGTHTLTTSEGEFFALKSDTLDLSDFNNKKVKVHAQMIDGYPVDSGPKFLYVEGIEILK